MGSLLITLLVGLLAVLKVISANTFMIIVASSVAWSVVAACIYFKFGCLKFFYHDILGWHTPKKDIPMWSDGCSTHATCKHCGKDIMQDSQGNWFTGEDV